VTVGGRHVVFGAGQIGRALAATLAEDERRTVRIVSRQQPAGLPPVVEWGRVDATDPDAATAAAAGASVIYQCLNAPYTKWPARFPPLQAGVLAAAERTGALLVTLENVYAYGPTGGTPMTEDLPLAAETVKGRVRAAMTRELLEAGERGRARVSIGRAADFFGPGVTESVVGRRFFGKAVAGKRPDFVGDPDLPHTYSYAADIARGLAMLGTDVRAVGQVWHLPGPETVTTTELVALVAAELERPVRLRRMPKALLAGLAIVSPMMKALAEMAYEFEQPFVLDTTKFEATFGTTTTPLRTAVRDTVAWYRDHRPEPETT
jgi:nucleoside-diphosphate-sugar epimerase